MVGIYWIDITSVLCPFASLVDGFLTSNSLCLKERREKLVEVRTFSELGEKTFQTLVDEELTAVKHVKKNMCILYVYRHLATLETRLEFGRNFCPLLTNFHTFLEMCK